MTSSETVCEVAAWCETAERLVGGGDIMGAAAALNAALAVDPLADESRTRIARCGEAIAGRLACAPVIDEATRTLLLIAARTARIQYGLLGDWQAIRRAESGLANASLVAGELDSALRHARQGVELCAVDEASDAERSAAHALLDRILAAQGT